MQIEEMGYDAVCKIIRKIGTVYSYGFHPWVPFVRSNKCKLIRADYHGDYGDWRGRPGDAQSISTYQDCVDIKLFDSDEELGISGRIILELSEYPGDSMYGRRSGPVRAKYVFEVLEIGDAVRDSVAREFGVFVRNAANEEMRQKRRRIQERIAKRTLKELGIC